MVRQAGQYYNVNQELNDWSETDALIYHTIGLVWHIIILTIVSDWFFGRGVLGL